MALRSGKEARERERERETGTEAETEDTGQCLKIKLGVGLAAGVEVYNKLARRRMWRLCVQALSKHIRFGFISARHTHRRTHNTHIRTCRCACMHTNAEAIAI